MQSNTHAHEYAELRQLLAQQGLFDRQPMYQSAWKTDVFGLLCTLLTAISYSWWTEKHNQHHRHPNHLERDPDVRLRFLAFSDEQTCATQGFRRCIVKHQAR